MKSIVGSTVTNLRFDRLASNSVVQFEFSDGRFLSFKGTEIEDYPQEFPLLQMTFIRLRLGLLFVGLSLKMFLP